MSLCAVGSLVAEAVKGGQDICVGQRVCVIKKDWMVLRSAVTLQVGGDQIANRDIGSVINSSNRNEGLKLGATQKRLHVIVPFQSNHFSD